jgi:glucose-1-phosphate cytidylyltransferase
VIKEYFASYALHRADVVFDLARGTTELRAAEVEPWRVTVAETGLDTMTGGRIRRVREYLDGEAFCLTYGDCVGDVDITALVAHHRDAGALATLTAVQPPGRFGALALGADDVLVRHFHEKPEGDGAWVNGGFFVVEPEVLDLIEDDGTVWEREPLERLAADGRLAAYRHTGFWQPMDTLRDKTVLEELWASGAAPWRVW